MKNKIEFTSEVLIDELSRQLKENLSTKELVEFAIGLSNNLTEEIEYLKLLRDKLNKLKLEE